ncbi:MAG: DUF429 domain-containing protein [Tagaea sp.]|nr:DUF429 domain-containing protein [Tagaea sp.]
MFRHARTGRAFPRFASMLAEVIDAPEAPRWIAVDMPMGFSETAEPGGRACERAARKILGPAGRASCVFSAPSRAALAADDYAAALKRNRAGAGVGLSKQAYNLFPKMREVDALLRARPGAGVFESHPEIVFARLAGEPLHAPKKTTAGLRTRLTLLEKAGFRWLRDWLDQFPRKAVAPDDMLDAAALCLTALRRARGQADCLPEGAPKDRFGVEMAIWR